MCKKTRKQGVRRRRLPIDKVYTDNIYRFEPKPRQDFQWISPCVECGHSGTGRWACFVCSDSVCHNEKCREAHKCKCGPTMTSQETV